MTHKHNFEINENAVPECMECGKEISYGEYAVRTYWMLALGIGALIVTVMAALW